MPADVRTVKRFAKFLLAGRIDQRHFRALDNGDIGTARLFQTPKRKHGGGFHPLVAAHGGDAQQVNLRSAQQHQQGEKIRSLRAGAVLVGNDFDFLLRRGQSAKQQTCEHDAR